MNVQLQCYPPVGRLTVVQAGELNITAILIVPLHSAEARWEVNMWFGLDKADWCAIPLLPLPATREPKQLGAASIAGKQLFFEGHIHILSSLRFTLRFRSETSSPWRWLNEEQGLHDGQLVVQPTTLESRSLSDLLPGCDASWLTTSLMSQSPRTRLWSLTLPVPPADGEVSSQTDTDLGTPWGTFNRWFALVRHTSAWLGPRQGGSCFTTDQGAVLCAFQSPSGEHLVFLATNGINNVLSVFQNTLTGALSLHARNDGNTTENTMVLIAEGRDFSNVVAAVMYHARSLLPQCEDSGPMARESDVMLNNGEEWYDGLGFCTWNSLGQNLTEESLLNAVARLTSEGIGISNLIIDDGWQSLDDRGETSFQRGWDRFEANSQAFPDGLKAAVGKVRTKAPELKHVTVWHALLGYWGGMAPQGAIANTYDTVEIPVVDDTRPNLPFENKITVVDRNAIRSLYTDFYAFLADAGINGVKTDVQSFVDILSSATARRSLIYTYLEEWARSSFQHFGNNSISCMSQFPQSLFRIQMRHDRSPQVMRNSDDFYPEIEDSHRWHIWANAYNAIFMQHLNVLPDWDMFQTVHAYSDYHAAARCVSGGPIYITDTPGEHNIDLIRQISCKTAKNTTVILRASVLGKAIDPYQEFHANLLLRIGAFHGAAGTGTPILAIFNTSARRIADLIPLADFPGANPATRYVVRAHTSGKISDPANPGSITSLLPVSLAVRAYEILTAFPLTYLSGEKHREIAITNLGLVGKMTGCAAIKSNSIRKMENKRISIKTKLKGLGILGIYISTLPDMTIDGDFMVTIQDLPLPRETVAISHDDDCVLEMDVERAWRQLGLVCGWNNEVEVKIYFSI